MTDEECAGVVKLDDGNLSWSNRRGQSWSITLADVAVIGEVVDDDGISITTLSHRLVLLTRELSCYQIPVHAAGLSFVRQEIQQKLTGVPIDLDLFGTTWISRVIWPEHLKGIPLFRLSASASASPLGKLFRWLRPQYEISLTDEVRSYLEMGQSR